MEKLNVKTWNEKFKLFCVANGLRYQDVAKIIDHSPITVSYWWRGVIKPREDTQKLLAEKLGLDIRIFDENADFNFLGDTRKLKWNNKFKAFCMSKGWTLQDVSDKTGFAKATITLWYQGNRRPKHDNILVLVDKLGIELCVFYEEDE